jgi:hypothetical protein
LEYCGHLRALTGGEVETADAHWSGILVDRSLRGYGFRAVVHRAAMDRMSQSESSDVECAGTATRSGTVQLPGSSFDQIAMPTLNESRWQASREADLFIDSKPRHRSNRLAALHFRYVPVSTHSSGKASEDT